MSVRVRLRVYRGCENDQHWKMLNVSRRDDNSFISEDEERLQFYNTEYDVHRTMGCRQFIAQSKTVCIYTFTS